MTEATGQVRGQVVFDSAWHPVVEQAAAGFSMMGSRRLVVTDYPAVYVHDTGGMGTPYVAAAEPAAEPGVSVGLADRSTRLVATIQLPGRSLQASTADALPREARAALAGLRGRLLPGTATAGFVSACAVSVTPEPEGGPGPELICYVVVADGRLQLRSGNGLLADWPANRVAVTAADHRAVRVRGGAVLAGRVVTGAVLHLVTSHEQRAFLALVGEIAGAADPGTTAPVTVRGLGADRTRAADCVLGESYLELVARDAGAIRFDLADQRFGIAGTADQFVAFHPESGPIAVHSSEPTFAQHLYAHPGVRAAAERSLADGPYPAQLPDGAPVACLAAADGLRVKGPGTDLRVPYPAIRTVKPTTVDSQPALQVATDKSEVVVVGTLELVRAVHVEVTTGGYATAQPGQVPDLLRAAAGLEEDYFLATVFGPAYELHAALLGEAAADGLATPARLPESDAERARIGRLLADGLAALQRHLDQVGSVLPAYVRHRDAQLLVPVTGDSEPPWLKAQETQLRQALAAPVQRAAAETAALAGQVARLVDLDPAALGPPASRAGTAAALGAAALLNPVFAVVGGVQAYRQHQQGEQRRARLDAQAARGWTLALERWNSLVGVTLPVLGYVLTEQVFGIRWDAARRLAHELRAVPAPRRGAAVRAVARLLARLDVLRRYPSAAGVAVRRGEIVAHLRAARDALTPGFPEL